jgi:hypothetical protein
MLETMDHQFQGNSVAEEHPEFDRLSSEYFARNVYACYLRGDRAEDAAKRESGRPQNLQQYNAEI